MKWRWLMNRQILRSSSLATLPLLLALLGCALADIQTTKPANPATATPQKRSSPSIHQVEQTWTLSDTYIGPATATCPQGEFALSGGWSVPPQGVQVVSAGVSGNTWSVSMISGNSVSKVTAYVECLAGVAGAVVTQRTVTFAVPQTLSNTSAESLPAPTLTCNAGEVPVGFGFDISTWSRYLYFVEAYPVIALGVRFWTIRMLNHTSLTAYMEARVECLSNLTVAFPLPQHPGNVKSVTVSSTLLYSPALDAYGPEIPEGQSASVQQDCPSGTVVAGGGVFYRGLAGGGAVTYLRATTTGWQGEVQTYSPHIYPHVAAICLSFT
jgi:hypothetical protein